MQIYYQYNIYERITRRDKKEKKNDTADKECVTVFRAELIGNIYKYSTQ